MVRNVVRTTLFAVLLAHSIVPNAAGRKFSNVVIDETGVSASSGDEALKRECKRFRPTIKQIQRYLLNAYPAPSSFGGHDRYSPCSAYGTAQYSPFWKISWWVNSGGFGTIDWGGGDLVYIFHKDNGWFDPVACTYGVSEKGEC